MRSPKKKKKKIRLKVLCVLLFLLYAIYQVVIYSINISIDNILIKGNNVLTDTEILDLSLLNNTTKFYFISENKTQENIEKSIFVKSCEVDKSFFADITISVEENKILFYYFYNNSLMLEGFNETTLFLNSYNVPTLINYVPSTILKSFVDKLSLIDQDLISKISEIEYSPNIKDDIILDEERFIFKMNDGNTVHVNTINLEKFANYNKILEVESNKGILYLDSSSDGNVFVFYE